MKPFYDLAAEDQKRLQEAEARELERRKVAALEIIAGKPVNSGSMYIGKPLGVTVQ